MEALAERFDKKSAHAAVVGLGYVGLPLAVELCRAGYPVTGIDVDSHKIELLRAGKSYVGDIPSSQIADLVGSGRFRPTTDFSAAADADGISICVPTPLRKTKDPDVSYVTQAAERVHPYLKSQVLVVLESTVYPGFTEELVVPILAGDTRKVGEDLFVAFSPERVDPGNSSYQTRNIPKVIGGVTPACAAMAERFYRGAVDRLHVVGSAKEAEMVKLLENTFRAVNIALVNELLLMADRMDIDMWRVVDAAASKPFGFMPFYPGPGIGGHCIPIDPVYLSWKAKSYDFFNRFIELATDINGNMPRFVVQKLMRLLNDRDQHIKGSRLLIVGMAYKPGVADTRESPGIELFRLFEQAGAHVRYHDPHVPELDIEGTVYRSVDLSQDELSGAACTVIATAHPNLDRDAIARHSRLVLDTRNALRDYSGPNIVRL